jgi:hypothetical protein
MAAPCEGDQKMNLEPGEELKIAKKPNGKWGIFLHLNGYAEPFDIRELKTEEMAEGWVDTTECNNLVDQFITKYRGKA